MRRFLITGAKFTGEAELLFNEAGIIEAVQVRNTSLNAKQRATLIQSVPATVEGLATAWERKLTIIEADIEETFDMFWSEFNNKRNRMNALKDWNRLPLTEKVKCRIRIKPYKEYIRRMNQGGFMLKQMYPDTWLRGKHWEDEWETLK